MSMKSAHPGRDFSRFDTMSTDELKEILYQDSLLTPEQESDTDAILYIMEVVAKREAQEHPEDIPSTEDAWASFNAYYRSEDSDGTSLYADSSEDIAPILTVVPDPSIEHSKPRKKLRFILRTAVVAAVLVAFLLGSSLIASASGVNLWKAVAQWTKETFGFNEISTGVEQRLIYPENDDPRDALLKYDITAPLLPNWMPNEYVYEELESMETPSRRVVHVRYSDKENNIGLTIALTSNTSPWSFEKGSQDVVIYTANGIEHYIMENLDEITIVWTVGSYECSLRGLFSMEDAQKIIDSIYRS